MGPVRQNPIQRTVITGHLSVLMTVHNFSTQYSTEQFWSSPLLPPDNVFGWRAHEKHKTCSKHTNSALIINTNLQIMNDKVDIHCYHTYQLIYLRTKNCQMWLTAICTVHCAARLTTRFICQIDSKQSNLVFSHKQAYYFLYVPLYNISVISVFKHLLATVLIFLHHWHGWLLKPNRVFMFIIHHTLNICRPPTTYSNESNLEINSHVGNALQLFFCESDSTSVHQLKNKLCSMVHWRKRVFVCTKWRQCNRRARTVYDRWHWGLWNSVLGITDSVSINGKHCFSLRQTRRIVDLADTRLTSTFP